MDNWKNNFIEKLCSSDKNTIKEAFAIIDEHKPKSLFKYRSVNEYNIDNFINDTVWCSTLNNFNDPYEGYVTFDHDEVYIQKLLRDKNLPFEIREYDILKNIIHNSKNEDMIKKYEEDKETTENAKRKFISETQKKKKICSFSTLWDNRLMWSHYANNHTGFCIEYCTEYNIDKIRGHLFPIIYSDKIFDITQDFINSTIEQPYRPMLPFIMAIIKDNVWEYENEWRIIIDNNEKSEFNLFPKAIYLGSKMNSFFKESFSNKAKQKNIDVYEVDMDINNYKLIRKLPA